MAKLNLKRESTILPDGAYQVRIERVEYKTGTNSDYLALQLRPVGHETLIFANVMLGEQARFFRNQFFDAFSLPTDGEIEIDDLRGQSGWANITQEYYDNRLKNSVKSWIDPELGAKLSAQSAPKPVSKSVAEANFYAEKVTKAASDPAETGDPAEVQKDEVPF